MTTVAVPAAGSMSPPVGFKSETVKDSAGSPPTVALSGVIEMAICALAWPATNETVPLVGVKSAPSEAVPGAV